MKNEKKFTSKETWKSILIFIVATAVFCVLLFFTTRYANRNILKSLKEISEALGGE
jgi:hypothetical protein